MPGLEKPLGNFLWEDPFWETAGCRDTFLVSLRCREVPVDISGVLRDVGVATSGDFFLSGHRF
jgi:hypothetical protein